MTLKAGATFGSYEIVAPLGVGGMGEVYRGLDTRLRREVAIKVLPQDLADDPERVARLNREARLLAAVSHPNIAAIHGVEERGGTIALVLELVEGPTLAERLAGGPMPVKTALPIALQVAQALEAAHARGIIHRDLKPANLKITADGRVKVLDFGVAKAVAAEVTASDHALTPPSLATRSGVVVGTPGYMSPEQAIGGTVDRRADVWAFGCVLFEMLSGRRPFAGATMSETLVRVLEHEPDWNALPRDVPPQLAHLLERCLRKDAHQRLQDIGDVRIELEDLLAGRQRPASWPIRGVDTRRDRVALGAGAVAALLVVAFIVWALLARTRPGEALPLRLAMSLPVGVILPMETGHPVLALSPDGKTLVFVGDDRGVRRLYKRALAEPDPRSIAGTEGAAAPFFSPDGAWIGFFDGLALKKVALAGGLPSAISEVTPITVNRGAAWIAPDSVLLAMSPNSGLSVRAISTGRVGRMVDWQPVTNDTAAYAWPSAIHGTPYVVFAENVSDSPDKARVSLLDRRTATVRPLVTGGTNPLASRPDQLLFVRRGSLYAVSMEVRSARVGAEERLLDSVITEAGGAAHVAVSRSGTMAYVSGPAVPRERELVWVDRRGGVTPLLAAGRDWRWPRLSPDGRRLAAAADLGANTDMYVLELNRMVLDRVTTDPGEDFGAVWSPDGTRLAFSSEQFSAATGPEVVLQSGTDGQVQPLVRSTVPSPKARRGSSWSFPTSWSADGTWIAYTAIRNANADVEVASTAGLTTARPFATNVSAQEFGAAFSPSGRFIAYVSNESGNEEVYVQPFPGPGRRVRISTEGGAEPLWNRNGLELFYRHGDDLMSVYFDNGSPLEPRAPTVLFTGHFDSAPYGGQQANYDISPDGDRFVFVRRTNLPRPAVIQVIINWPRALTPGKPRAR